LDDLRGNIVIHRARWVLPLATPPIENGAVVVANGRIISTGQVHDVTTHQSGATVCDHGDSAIFPAFVNCHVHTELSALKKRLTPDRSFVQWVKELIALRRQIPEQQHRDAILSALDEMHSEGIAGFADIMNTDLTPEVLSAQGNRWGFSGFSFKEVIDPQGKWQFQPKPNKTGDIHREQVIHTCYSAHALYSVASCTLKAVKAWCNARQFPFSIHMAESLEEVEYITEGKGSLADFIALKAADSARCMNNFVPANSPVALADVLGLLDAKTLCIHCVQVSKKDMHLLSKQKATVCLCPQSNRFLSTGVAPVGDMLSSGIRLCIGTDSLASNDRLSMLAEMALIHEQHPAVEEHEILRMATLNGAKCLGLSGLGSLEPGKQASFLKIELPCDFLDRPVSFLVSEAAKIMERPGIIHWVT